MKRLTPRTRARCSALALAFSSFTLAGAAFAAPSAQEVALAETLFRDAQKLVQAGNYAEACPKFAESQRLDPAGGTLMNLAACHEAAGMLASAWAEFTDAAAWATRENRPDRVPIIQKRLAELEPRLSKLTLSVKAPVQGLTLELDGVVIGQPAWNSPLPINPGRHTVRAAAPGFRERTAELEIAGEKQEKAFEVPPLEPLPAEAAPASGAATKAAAKPAPPPAESSLSGKRLAGVITAGSGVVLLGVGSVFGVSALSKMSQSDEKCPNGHCSAEGAKLSEQANTAANFANVFVGAGLAAVGVGAYLYFTGGPKNPQAARLVVTPAVGVGTAGLVLDGAL